MEQNFSPTDISETDLRDIKLVHFFVWDFRGMFENLKQIELLICHIEKLHRATILTTTINGNSHQIFLNQQNALGTHEERADEYFMSVGALKLSYMLSKTNSVTRKYHLGCLLTTVQTEIDTWILFLEYSTEISH